MSSTYECGGEEIMKVAVAGICRHAVKVKVAEKPQRSKDSMQDEPLLLSQASDRSRKIVLIIEQFAFLLSVIKYYK